MAEIYREPSSGGLPTGTRKWLSCEFALAQTDLMLDSRDVPREGFNSDYSCSEEHIVELADQQGITTDKYTDLEAVELFGMGYTSDLHVQEILQRICGKCPYYKSRES